MNIISIRKLYYGYVGKKYILHNINVDIEEGKFTSIIGKNGSGKSTLIKCILGLNKVSKGKIEVNTKLGFMPQRMNIQTNFPASVSEVVLSGTLPNSLFKIFYTKKDRELANKKMRDLKIYDIRNKSFADLSGGQQQRVLIARSLCASDKLIILDEPTNGLDKNMTKEIYTILDDLKNKFSTTIVMVSHDLDRMLNYADNVIELENGEVIFNGNVKDYLERGNIND